MRGERWVSVVEMISVVEVGVRSMLTASERVERLEDRWSKL